VNEWVLSWGDNTWSVNDLTAAHLVLICEGLGEDTWDFDPRSGPRRFLAVLGSFIAVAEGVPLVDVMVALSATPVETLMAGLQTVEG